MFPNLPTDNLYKFSALSGIAVVAGAFWSIWSMEEAILREEAVSRGQYIAYIGDLETEMNRFASILKGNSDKPFKLRIGLGTHEAGYIPVKPGSELRVLCEGQDRAAYRVALAGWDEAMIGYMPPDHRVHEADAGSEPESKAEIKPEFDRQTIQRLREQLREHALSAEILWLRMDFQKPLKRVAIIAGVIGFTLSIWGFVSWYRTIQRPQDLLLRYQVQKEAPKSE